MDEQLRTKLQAVFKEGYFLERQRAVLGGLNPIGTPPAWMDEELQLALDAIGSPHERKKRTTVLRVAEAKASGVAIRPLFLSEDCCTPPIWYGRQTGPDIRVGWQDQPEIAAALTLALRKAHAYYDSLEEQRMMMRRQILDETQDRLTEISGAAVEVLMDIMLDPQAASDVRRKAAVDALTHAAPETAPKSDQHMDVSVTTTGPTMRDVRNRKRRLPDRVVDMDVESVPDPVPALEAVQGSDDDGPPPPAPGGLTIPKTSLYDAPPVISDNGSEEEEEE